MTDALHEREVLAWREARRARLLAEDGWLSLAARVELEDGRQRVGSAEDAHVRLPDRAPRALGELIVRGTHAQFVPSPAVTLTLRKGDTKEERPLLDPTALATDRAGTPDRILYEDIGIELLERSGRLAARVRDAQNPARTEFGPIPYYPIDPRYRVVAKLLPHPVPRRIDLGYESGASERYESPGQLSFTLHGQPLTLTPVLDGPRPRLFVLFRDATAPRETYGAGRFLYAPLPKDGLVTLDFNQAFNPPCAFTPFALCPLPPDENLLSVRIEAGEKKPL